MKFFRQLISVLVVALSLSVSHIVNAQDKVTENLASESVIESIKKRGTLRIGVDLFAPWAMRSKSGELIGFEIEVAKKLAEDMGVKGEWVPTAWDGIIPALLEGKFDVIISGMSVTPQRHLRLNFTDGYASTGTLLVANKRNVPGLSSPAEFNNPDITIGAKRGTNFVDSARKHTPKAKLRQYDDETVALQDLMNGMIDGYFSATPTPERSVARSGGRLYLPFSKLDGTIEAIGVRKGDPDALTYFNNWIKLRQLDGWLEATHKYWFEGEEWTSQVQ